MQPVPPSHPAPPNRWLELPGASQAWISPKARARRCLQRARPRRDRGHPRNAGHGFRSPASCGADENPTGSNCPATSPRSPPTCGAAQESRPGKVVSRGELATSTSRHRKAWVQERLATLVGIFGVAVAGFAAMSSHLHVIPNGASGHPRSGPRRARLAFPGGWIVSLRRRTIG